MAIKKLQNDFTTPEQTRRLLELGVPAWTANIMFDKNRRMYELIETEDESLAETQRTLFYNGGATPHWSVGRLIEVLEKSWNSALPICCDIIGENDKVLYIVETIQHFANHSMLDFSKLED